jgi:hypothetical protein
MMRRVSSRRREWWRRAVARASDFQTECGHDGVVARFRGGDYRILVLVDSRRRVDRRDERKVVVG